MPSPAGLVVKNGLNILLAHLGRDAGAVVADADLDPVAEVLVAALKRRLVVAAVGRGLALGRGIEAVRDQVQQHARDLLRIEVDVAGGRIE